MEDKKQKQNEMLRRIQEMREQRRAKEKARIEKLREMNLKKYKTEESKQSVFTSRPSTAQSRPKNYNSMDARKSLIPRLVDAKTPNTKDHVNDDVDKIAASKDTKLTEDATKEKTKNESFKKTIDSRKSFFGNMTSKDIVRIAANIKLPVTTKTIEKKSKIQSRRSIAPKLAPVASIKKIYPHKTVPIASIKPIQKVIAEQSKDIKTNRAATPKLSVFERLYSSKNKTTREEKRSVSSHANCSKPIKENNKMRRSISAVHFKRVGKNELKNCFHRYSLGDGLNKLDIDPADTTPPQIVNSIRSDRKKVKFHIGTPKPDELERRLKNWLQKRGKSVDSYHHLRCFGVHLAPAEFDDENKENISVEISHDGSFDDLVNGDPSKMWREACFNDSEIYSECAESEKSPNSALTPLPKPKVDEILLSALTDLSQLVREGYDWEQCARWLRAIRDKCPHAPSIAAYWECRAALEEFRGNLPRSWLCWEEAISKGTEASVAEASIDQLLDKFMQLNIDPGTGARPSPSRKDMMSAKTIFRSSLIRFAVHNAKTKSDEAKYTVTPVRRSSRNATTPRAVRTPLLQLASSLTMIDRDIREKAVFIPNKLLQYSP